MNLNSIQNSLQQSSTKMDLYEIAGQLNNLPEHIHADKVTCLGFMDFEYAKAQVQNMLDESIKARGQV